MIKVCKKMRLISALLVELVGGQDLNLRPPRPERGRERFGAEAKVLSRCLTQVLINLVGNAIKILGSNGGGFFFKANASHPFENPRALSNYLLLKSHGRYRITCGP